MLDKIAECAQWCDARGYYEYADKLTGILTRTALAQVTDEDDDPEPSPDEYYTGQMYHDRPEIHAASPEWLDYMKQANPEGYEWWRQYLTNKGIDTVPPEEHQFSILLGGRPIHFPKGVKTKLTADEAAHFFLTPEVQRQNDQASHDRFNKITRDRKHRGYFDIKYLSGNDGLLSDDPEIRKQQIANNSTQRLFSYDPHIMQYLKDDYNKRKEAGETMHGPDPNAMVMPFFDPRVLRQVFDPTVVPDPDIQAKFRDKEGKLKPLPTQAGYAVRNLVPSKIFEIGRHLRDRDPETGRPVKNFYPRLRDIG